MLFTVPSMSTNWSEQNRTPARPMRSWAFSSDAPLGTPVSSVFAVRQPSLFRRILVRLDPGRRGTRVVGGSPRLVALDAGSVHLAPPWSDGRPRGRGRPSSTDL